MSCTDEYENWLHWNEELEDLREKEEAYEDEWEASFYDAMDAIPTKPGTFFEELGQSDDAFDNMVETQWEADRLENGDWSEAVDDLWECINKHGG